jgi:hypothetical protein
LRNLAAHTVVLQVQHHFPQEAHARQRLPLTARSERGLDAPMRGLEHVAQRRGVLGAQREAPVAQRLKK